MCLGYLSAVILSVSGNKIHRYVKPALATTGLSKHGRHLTPKNCAKLQDPAQVNSEKTTGWPESTLPRHSKARENSLSFPSLWRSGTLLWSSYFLLVEHSEHWHIKPVNTEWIKLTSLQKLTNKREGGLDLGWGNWKSRVEEERTQHHPDFSHPGFLQSTPRPASVSGVLPAFFNINYLSCPNTLLSQNVALILPKVYKYKNSKAKNTISFSA